MTEIDQNELNELFELEGEKESEVAEPAETEKTQGERGQEVAEPAEAEANETESGEEDPEGTEDTQSGQGKDENARFASARRKAEAERDAAIRRAQEDAERQINEMITAANMTNPYTGEVIKTKQEFDEYMARHNKERENKLRQSSGMSDEEFSKFVESLPQVRAANLAKAQADAALRKAQEAEMRAEVDKQIREIGQLDPSIKSLEDIPKMENYGEFYAYVQKGLSFIDAYKLANYAKLTQQAARGATRAALNAAHGKNHMAATSQRGTGTVTVPDDVKAAYRQFSPDITDADIEKHYNKYLKQKGQKG